MYPLLLRARARECAFASVWLMLYSCQAVTAMTTVLIKVAHKCCDASSQQCSTALPYIRLIPNNIHDYPVRKHTDDLLMLMKCHILSTMWISCAQLFDLIRNHTHFPHANSRSRRPHYIHHWLYRFVFICEFISLEYIWHYLLAPHRVAVPFLWQNAICKLNLPPALCRAWAQKRQK